PVENLGAFDPEIGEPVIVQRHAARQPPIGGVALGKPLQFARRPYPFDRRIEPQRKQNRGIGGRPSRLPLARPYPLVKLRQIEALDETPHQARAMVRRQKPLQIDHVPTQLLSIWSHHPSVAHRRLAPKESASENHSRAEKTISSHALKRESRDPRAHWMPAFASMTDEGAGRLRWLRQARPGRKSVPSPY